MTRMNIGTARTIIKEAGGLLHLSASTLFLTGYTVLTPARLGLSGKDFKDYILHSSVLR